MESTNDPMLLVIMLLVVIAPITLTGIIAGVVYGIRCIVKFIRNEFHELQEQENGVRE